MFDFLFCRTKPSVADSLCDDTARIDAAEKKRMRKAKLGTYDPRPAPKPVQHRVALYNPCAPHVALGTAFRMRSGGLYKYESCGNGVRIRRVG